MSSFTNIPTTGSFDNIFGTPGLSRVKQQDIQNLILLDRTVYAGRFNNIAAHRRPDENAAIDLSNANLQAYQIDTRWHCMFKGVVYTIPDVFPGSNNVTTTNSGATLGTRGGFVGAVRGININFFYGIRTISIAGTYGQSTTFGTWNWASGSNTGTDVTPPWDWGFVTDINTSVANHVLFPTSISTGDTVEACLWVRRNSVGSAGWVSGWMLSEATQLSSIAP